MYAHTGQYGSRARGSLPASLQQKAIDYDETTRDVLGMYQDTGFLEKGLVKLRRGLKKMVSQLEVIETTVPEARTEFVVTENARIGERLEEMMDEYEGLIEECKLIKDEASLLNIAVSRKFHLLTIRPKQCLISRIDMELDRPTRQHRHPINRRCLARDRLRSEKG